MAKEEIAGVTVPEDVPEPRAATRKQVAVALAVCATLLAATVVGGSAIREALEERGAEAAGNDLRLAAQTVTVAELIASNAAAGAPTPVGPGRVDLVDAIATIEDRRGAGLHALTPAERREAEALLDELAEHGNLHLEEDHECALPMGHERLQDLLAESVAASAAGANAAERLALLAMIVAALAAGAAGWLLLRSRTNELRLRQSLYRQANTDLLTGLPNRRMLDRALDDAGRRMTETGCSAALIFLDLDGFKDINDTLGHKAGDEVLAQVADRLRRARRDDDLLIRLGGDEFAVLLPACGGAEGAKRVAHRYLQMLDEPFDLEDRTERLRTSVGVTVTDDPTRIKALAAEADLAMYEAKRSGGHRVAMFVPTMESDANATSRITWALRSADYGKEFHLVYQPIVTVDGGTTVGYEALLRWDSPALGSVRPDVFIPVAERSGEICAIGEWVIEQVCRQIRVWEDHRLARDLTVSCNVSPLQLAEDRFVPNLLEVLDRWEIPRWRLVVEVTESAVLDHEGVAVRRLEELRTAGIRISIDDFGSGYSNLGQLLQVPFDVIKIDRSLLLTLSEMRAQAGGDPSDPCAIMQSIVSIAGVFDAPVICEGVETEIQRQSLEVSGITHIQGYLIGRPGPPPGAGIERHRPVRPRRRHHRTPSGL